MLDPSFYQGLAGSVIIEWVYMISMAGIGIALRLGILTRLAAMAGIAWMIIFFTASAICCGRAESGFHPVRRSGRLHRPLPRG